jgi:endonuclease YncB( thermonuclease family)
MLAKLIALGQDRLKPTSYARGLEQRPFREPKITVRIAFVDAPEKGQPFGQRAKQANERARSRQRISKSVGKTLLKGHPRSG